MNYQNNYQTTNVKSIACDNSEHNSAKEFCLKKEIHCDAISLAKFNESNFAQHITAHMWISKCITSHTYNLFHADRYLTTMVHCIDTRSYEDDIYISTASKTHNLPHEMCTTTLY